MSHRQPLPRLFAALLLCSGLAHAVEPAAEAERQQPLLSQLGNGFVNTTQTLTHTLTDTVKTTVSGTVTLAGSVTGIVTDTVKSSVNGTVNAAGKVGGAVAGGVRSTVAGTVSVAGTVGGAVADTVKTTAFGTVRAAGTVTSAVLSTAGSTVTGAVRLADAVGTIVAGTVTEAARTLVAVPRDMLYYATSLIGTPYKWGGTSTVTGMDCSGFVQQVVRASTGKTLPRTAREMAQHGNQVDKSELKPGDLVFFNTRRRPFSHVGIYLGDGEFVHGASGKKSGKQIRIDKLSSSYYTKRFNGARRLSEISLD